MTEENEHVKSDVRRTTETFGMVTFTKTDGKKRSLRADFFWSASEGDSPNQTMVYYERKRDSGYFKVAHTVEEVNQMVAEALQAKM